MLQSKSLRTVCIYIERDCLANTW